MLPVTAIERFVVLWRLLWSWILTGLTQGVCVDEISPERLTGPLVVLDVAKECRSSDVYAVSDVDILKHEKKHGQIAKKSIVCAYTAWSKRWDDPFRYKVIL
jgi:kynurenine formamidase